MRFLRPAYLRLVGPGGVPERQQFSEIFDRIQMLDGEFNTDTFLPGTSGEVALYNSFLQKSGI